MTDPTAKPSAPAVAGGDYDVIPYKPFPQSTPSRLAALAAVRDRLIRLQDAQTGLEPTGAAFEAAAAKHVDHAIERLVNARLVS